MANLTRLTRAEHVVFIDFCRYPSRAKTVRATSKSRGYITCDAAGIADKVTTLVVGNVLGIRAKRDSTLVDGHMHYYGCDGVQIL